MSGLLRSRRVPVVIAAVYVAFGLLFVATDYALNDEGLCIYIFGMWARLDFIPAFFFQKAKPVLELVYLLPSAGGVRGTMAVHVLLAACAMPVFAAVARKLGHSAPNLPAFIVAFSPLYFYGGAAGIENVDGVLGTVLFLYLLVVRENELWAGVVLGMLPWVRHELALLAAIFFVRAVVMDRSRRLAAGILVFPVLFTLAGVVYHRDPLWLLHFPPTTAVPMPGNPVWAPVTPSTTLENLLSVSPLAALAFAVRLRQLRPVERTLMLFAAVWLVLLTVLPIWRVGNFGFVARYALQLLPALALFASRALDRWREGERPGLADVAFLAGLFVLWLVPHQLLVGVALALAGVIAVFVLARTGRANAAVVASVLLACAGPALPNDEQLTTAKSASYLAPMTEWLRDGQARTSKPIYTNAHLLAAHLGSAAALPGVDVRYLVGVDMNYDLIHLTDPANGQTAAIRALAKRELYGRGVLPDTLDPERIPDGALFLLRTDPRVVLLLPPARWSSHLVPLETRRSFGVYRFVRDAPGQKAATRD